MSKNYDMIATVDIDITSPIVDDSSFDNLLIVGPLPKKAPKEAPAKVGVYSSIDEVIAAGWNPYGDDADPVGAAALVAFAQNPTPNAVYIAPQQPTDATEDAEIEHAVNTVQRAITTAGWYFLCAAGVPEEEYEEIADLIETQEKIFLYTEMNCFEESGEAKPTVSNSHFRTFGFYGRVTRDQADEDVPAYNWYTSVAMAAKWLSYESGSETAAFKTLALIQPSALSTADMKALEKACLNFFVTVGNKNISMNGKVLAGEWADIIRFRDWLKNDMQVRVVNAIVTRSKIPYTDGGIALIQNQMIASLKAGQDVGGIAEEEFDEDGNSIPGFVTSVPRSASLTESEKASRILPRCKFKARLAGAIHFAEITGSLTYSL